MKADLRRCLSIWKPWASLIVRPDLPPGPERDAWIISPARKDMLAEPEPVPFEALRGMQGLFRAGDTSEKAHCAETVMKTKNINWDAVPEEDFAQGVAFVATKYGCTPSAVYYQLTARRKRNGQPARLGRPRKVAP